jgi:hypothetical protein
MAEDSQGVQLLKNNDIVTAQVANRMGPRQCLAGDISMLFSRFYLPKKPTSLVPGDFAFDHMGFLWVFSPILCLLLGRELKIFPHRCMLATLCKACILAKSCESLI